MAFTLPNLPFAKNALEPYLSEETVEFHYGKHHRAYVDNLNSLVAGTDLENKSLEELITTQEGAIFNNAGQLWNHNFYWSGLRPKEPACVVPQGKLAEAIEKSFDSFESFKQQFSKAATGHFGSGWAWLSKNNDGSLEVSSTSDADNPLTQGKTPLLTCDVWEHAYYIGYRNRRPEYVEKFWDYVNWDHVTSQFEKC